MAVEMGGLWRALSPGKKDHPRTKARSGKTQEADREWRISSAHGVGCQKVRLLMANSNEA